MSKNTNNIDSATANRILAYLNSLRNADELTKSPEEGGDVKDDPISGSEGSGYTIGATVAARIINTRNSLRGRRFSSIDQLVDIDGLGQDKLNDLAYSFSATAEDRFIRSLYDGIILDNWNVRYSDEHFEDRDEFESIVYNEANLENWVVEQVKKTSLEQFDDRHRSLLSGELARDRYIESYPEAHLGSYAWALWFYSIDQDNWFSFERIRTAIESFLGTYEGISGEIELRLLKGFPNWSGLAQGITPLDLPVTLNKVEQRLSIWAAELFD